MRPGLKLDRASGDTVPLVNLRGVDARHRRSVWDGTVRRVFPSLSVDYPQGLPQVGSIARTALGAGDLLEIETAPAEVRHPGVHHSGRQSISLILQREGVTRIAQGRGTSTLSAGDLSLIDDAHPFRMVNPDCSRFLVLRLPRAAVLGRQPRVHALLGNTLAGASDGNRFLGHTLLGVAEQIERLTVDQRRALVGGFIELLAMAEAGAGRSPGDWRVRRTLEFVERNLGLHGLSAQAIADALRLSRRRLDEVMKAELGQSVAQYLWDRRLTRTAEDLRHERFLGLGVFEVGHANGFTSPSHFTRTFKSRFGATPVEWRESAFRSARPAPPC